jgi:hypothetical protein
MAPRSHNIMMPPHRGEQATIGHTPLKTATAMQLVQGLLVAACFCAVCLRCWLAAGFRAVGLFCACSSACLGAAAWGLAAAVVRLGAAAAGLVAAGFCACSSSRASPSNSSARARGAEGGSRSGQLVSWCRWLTVATWALLLHGSPTAVKGCHVRRCWRARAQHTGCPDLEPSEQAALTSLKTRAGRAWGRGRARQESGARSCGASSGARAASCAGPHC